jgi:hypothetical protein
MGLGSAFVVAGIDGVNCPTSAPIDRLCGLKKVGFLAHRSLRGVEISQKSGHSNEPAEKVEKNIRRRRKEPHCA